MFNNKLCLAIFLQIACNPTGIPVIIRFYIRRIAAASLHIGKGAAAHTGTRPFRFNSLVAGYRCSQVFLPIFYGPNTFVCPSKIGHSGFLHLHEHSKNFSSPFDGDARRRLAQIILDGWFLAQPKRKSFTSGFDRCSACSTRIRSPQTKTSELCTKSFFLSLPQYNCVCVCVSRSIDFFLLLHLSDPKESEKRFRNTELMQTQTPTTKSRSDTNIRSTHTQKETNYALTMEHNGISLAALSNHS